MQTKFKAIESVLVEVNGTAALSQPSRDALSSNVYSEIAE